MKILPGIIKNIALKVFPLIFFTIVLMVILSFSSSQGVTDPGDEVQVSSLPGHWDWNELGKVSPVKNVQSCGSIWAFSAVAAVESKILILANVEVDLAEQQLLSCEGGGGSCGGGSSSLAFNYIRDEGLVDETCFPYGGKDDIPCQPCEQTNRAKIEGFYYVSMSNDLETNIANIKEAIYNDGPVVVYFQVYSDFYSYSSGIYRHTSGSEVGMSALILVGWDDVENYWIAKNSWGPNWGENGFLRIARDTDIDLYRHRPMAVLKTDYNGDGVWDGEGNQPPVALCRDVTASADTDCQADVTAGQIDDGSFDPDGSDITLSLSPEGPYPVGETEVILTVSDGQDSSTCSALITITADTSSNLIVISDPIELWPPNHKYETIDVNRLLVSVTDSCGTRSIENVYIASVSSDEEENAQGIGDGNTIADIIISADCKSVQLRKERQGGGNGRVYTIVLVADEANGNILTNTCKVTVNHNRNGDPAIDNGAVYIVNSSCGGSTDLNYHTETLQISDGYQLNQNYPNPFNPSTTIEFTLANPEYVELKVYNILCKEVAVLVSTHLPAGIHRYQFDGMNLASGIYYYKIIAGQYSGLKKMILLR